MLHIERGTPAVVRHLVYGLHNVARILRAVAAAPRARASWGRILNLPAFGTVVAGSVYRSGAPRAAVHFQHMLALNIKTVICVRRGGPGPELRELTAAYGMDLRVFDLVSGGGCDLNGVLCAARAALDPGTQPALVCCEGGRHHAGMVVALLRLQTGYTLEEALAEYYSFAAPSPYEDNVLFIVRAARDLFARAP